MIWVVEFGLKNIVVGVLLGMTLIGRSISAGETVFPRELTGEILYEQGLNLYNQEKYQEAIPCFKEASARKSNFAEAYYRLGLCYIKTEQFEEAKRNLICAKSLTQDGELRKNAILLIEKKPEDMMREKKERDRKKKAQINSLVYSLIKDVIVLLPEELRNKIFQDSDIDAVMARTANAVVPEKPLDYSTTIDNFVVQAFQVAMNVYKGVTPDNMLIPQTVYYNGFEKIDDIQSALSTKSGESDKTERSYKNQYNLALNIIINLWLCDFTYSKYEVSKMPTTGVYVRDLEQKIYLYEGG